MRNFCTFFDLFLRFLLTFTILANGESSHSYDWNYETTTPIKSTTPSETTTLSEIATPSEITTRGKLSTASEIYHRQNQIEKHRGESIL